MWLNICEKVIGTAVVFFLIFLRFLWCFSESLLFKETVFCFQNSSDLLWEFFFAIEKFFLRNSWLRLRILKNIEITWRIYSNSERSVHILKNKAFLTYSWKFLRPNTLEAALLPKWFPHGRIILAKEQLDHSCTFWTMSI